MEEEIASKTNVAHVISGIVFLRALLKDDGANEMLWTTFVAIDHPSLFLKDREAEGL